MLDRVGRYIVGRKSFSGAWEDDTIRTATRDFAVFEAVRRSKKTGQHHYVVDTGQVPHVEIGFGQEGRFVWAPWIVTEYAQPAKKR